MGQKRYTPEFKDEAVRQVTEKGHPVQEVAARLGVSSHSLYSWVKAVRYSVPRQAVSAKNFVPSKSASRWNIPWIA